jgi:N-acylethanolamine-hydrolysing acid amidase
MDWDLPQLRDLTIEVKFFRNLNSFKKLDFQKGGKTLFLASSWAGYVGVLTGVRPNSYSVSINFRRTEKGNLWQNIKQSLKGGWPTGFLVRVVLEEDNSFT